MDEPGPETIGVMGDGPAATVAMSRATWAAVVVRVCGRCGVVGGLVRDVGGRDRDVGCCGRDLGGRDRSVGPQRGQPGGGFCVSAVSVADDGWERGRQGLYRRCYGAEADGELGARRPGGGGRLVERFRSFRVQHLAADWVDQQPVGGQEV